MKKILFWGLFGLLGVLGVLGLLGRARASDINFSVVPSKIEFEAETGSTVTKFFTIFNESTEDATYQLTLQDYSINQENEFKYFPAGEQEYSLAGWIKLPQEKVTVAAKSSAKVEFTVSVPAGIVPHGYQSIIFVSTVESGAKKEGAVLNVAGRIGVTVLGAVKSSSDQSGLIRKGSIKDLQVNVSFPSFIEWENGHLGLNFNGLFKPEVKSKTIFHNSGNVFLTLKGETKFLPQTFGKAETVELPNLTTLPNTDRNLEATWSTPTFLGKVKVETKLLYEGGEWLTARKEIWIVSWNLVWFTLAVLFVLLLILLATLRAHKKHKKLEKVMEDILAEEERAKKDKGKRKKEELKVLEEVEEELEEEAKVKHPGWRVFGWLVLILAIVISAGVLGWLLARIVSIPLELTPTPTETQAKATATPVVISTPEVETTQTTQVSPTATSVLGEEYTVKSGDTLFGIAQKFGIDWEDLAKANNLEPPYTLYVGDKLVIPKK